MCPFLENLEIRLSTGTNRMGAVDISAQGSALIGRETSPILSWNDFLSNRTEFVEIPFKFFVGDYAIRD